MKINSPALTYNAYTIENKSAYIVALQRMLFIPQSGRLDKLTVEKLRQFKEMHGLVSEHLVDFQTFEMIKAVHQKSRLIKSGGKLLPYEHSDEFYSVTKMLCAVITLYSLPLRPPKGAVYGYDAIRAVKRLREIYCLEAIEVIDGEFLHYLSRDFESINAMKKRHI